MSAAAYEPVVQDEETFELQSRADSKLHDEEDENSSPPSFRSISNGGRSANPLYLIIYFLINHVAFGIIMVPRMNLFMTLICRDLGQSPSPVIVGGMNPECHSATVSSATAALVSGTTMISGIMGVFMAPFLGRLSDRIGRLRVLVWNMGIICLSRLALLAVIWGGAGSKWVYLSFVVYGISGTSGTTMNVSAAYISDCTTPATRSVQIGRVHGIMFAGMAVGPLISSAITKLSANKLPLLVFYIDFFLIALSVLYLFFIVPESLNKPLEGVMQGLRNTFQGFNGEGRFGKRPSVLERLKVLDPRRWLQKLVPTKGGVPGYLRTNVLLLILINLIIVIGATAPSDVAILYPQTAFDWTNVETNIFMAVVNTFRAVATIVGLPLLIAFFQRIYSISPNTNSDERTGADRLDRTLIITGIICDISGFLGYALSPNGILYIVSGALAAFGGIGQPTTVSALTKHIDADRFGELMGGLGMLQGLVDFVAPASVSLVYSWTATTIPQLAFFGLSAWLGVGVALTLFVRVKGAV